MCWKMSPWIGNVTSNGWAVTSPPPPTREPIVSVPIVVIHVGAAALDREDFHGLAVV
jgi:hypothetical protein